MPSEPEVLDRDEPLDGEPDAGDDAPPQEANEDEGDEGEPVRWVTVGAFWSASEAHLARLRVEAEGIDCVLLDEFLVATDWLYANATGGIKLQVQQADAARARDLLTQPWRRRDDSEDDPEEEPAADDADATRLA